MRGLRLDDMGRVLEPGWSPDRRRPLISKQEPWPAPESATSTSVGRLASRGCVGLHPTYGVKSVRGHAHHLPSSGASRWTLLICPPGVPPFVVPLHTISVLRLDLLLLERPAAFLFPLKKGDDKICSSVHEAAWALQLSLGRHPVH